MGPNCSQNLQKLLPNSFFTWKVIMIILNLVLFIVSCSEVFKPRTRVRPPGIYHQKVQLRVYGFLVKSLIDISTQFFGDLKKKLVCLEGGYV